jgi:PTS system nitrogen regulatory IIA component
MVELASLIDESRILLNVPADCPTAVFRCVSEALEPLVGVDARTIANALNERERMGSTAVGDGVSIPHARLESVEAPQAFMLRLQKPIDMDAMDDKPVDVFFILLVPEKADNDHLRVLSRVARLIRQPGNLEHIRASANAAGLAALFEGE